MVFAIRKQFRCKSFSPVNGCKHSFVSGQTKQISCLCQCCCYLVSSIGKLRCSAPSVHAVHSVSTVSAVGCVDDQLDVWRRCWKVRQIVIDERWRQNSALYHSCFHHYAFRFLLPKMNFGSSVLHIVVQQVMNCCRYFDVLDTIGQSLMFHIVECSVFIKKPAAMSAVIVDSAVHVECFGRMPC